MPILRVVMDTNVLYAGFRSRQSASYELLDALWQRRWRVILSQTVITEYEEVLRREAVALRLTPERIVLVLDALCSLAERHSTSETWIPVLRDPDDEAFVQLAAESRADGLVSHNLRHLEPARKLGLNLLEPRQFLAMLRTAS